MSKGRSKKKRLKKMGGRNQRNRHSRETHEPLDWKDNKLPNTLNEKELTQRHHRGFRNIKGKKPLKTFRQTEEIHLQ